MRVISLWFSLQGHGTAPGNRNRKKGVREIYTYLKAFDHVEFVSINGNLLITLPRKTIWKKTQINEDVILFTVSEPIKGKDFRQERTAMTPEGEDPKQFCCGPGDGRA